MAERSSLNQVVQFGVEAAGAAGTSVAVTKRMTAMSIEPSINADIDTFRPQGQKYSSLTALSREWTEADVSGRGTYTEIVYALSSLIDEAVLSTPSGGTASRTWTFTPDSTADQIPGESGGPKTYTVQHGSGSRADQFTYGVFTELGMAFSRDSVELSGSMMGRAMTDGVTLTTAGITTIALKPILPTHVSVYLDTASGGLGTTKLARVLSAEWTLGARFGPVYVLDAANTGYVAMVETEPDLTLDLVLEADSEGMGGAGGTGNFIDMLRNGTTKYMRIAATSGENIESTIKYSFTLDMAVKVADTGGFSDEDGVYATEWNLVGVHDSTWGKAFQIAVTNNLTAL